EAVEKMEENPNIPSAFRDIFRRAYLPYNDPATLRMFLKVIDDGFHYSQSEMLGDAFEYLLSILGTQGDAGQFRTPRHIIDFVAACVNPQKGDVICDPACGTAGFVIAAYKHILKQNTKTNSGDLLSAEDRKKLAQNLIGLDIDPMMVKLALANMYLHGFQDPHIYEYDSLTSEDKWDDTYDVVLANPPFMTPKGGIRPHKRFTTQANKAEVLFVDLISSHLTANGRAGIIVPNGIVATTQTAYKNLRKILIEDSLIAVISLPAGVFQPYSGVKTSILILDKALSKKSDSVLFIKVDNDGFDLGSQRKEIDKNDLPHALNGYSEYVRTIKNGSVFKNEFQKVDCILVKKQIILNNRDLILSGDRYKIASTISKSNYILKPLLKIADIKKGSTITKRTAVEGFVPVVGGGQSPAYYHNKANRNGACITISSSGAYSGFINYYKEDIYASDCTTLQPLNEDVLIKYLYYALKIKQNVFYKLQVGAGQPHVYSKDFENIQIPLPPIEIQEQIVAEIEGYQKIIDGAKMVVDNYKPTISIKPDWEIVELGSVCEINPKKSEVKDLGELEVSFLPMADLNENEMFFKAKDSRLIKDVYKGYTYFKENDLLLAKVTPCFENGKAGLAKNLLNGIGFGSSEYFVLRANNKLIKSELIYYYINSYEFLNRGKTNMSGTSGLQRLYKDFVSEYVIGLPPMEEQETIVKQIEVEQKIVESNKQLIEIYEQKIKDRIAQVWGEE
ncbi:N-6 DNA methylase, partial [Seonamhaeicola sp.]|uniref:N-6 DNA methylase n=1 Tax=Seonamhaeicola sp. TaxID=1912245 RepID=UPI0035694B91